MDRQKFEQRCAIKFCVKLGESATVTYEKLQRAYGEHSLSRAQVFRWHKSFLEGREQVEDEPRAGRPSTSKTDDSVERVMSLVRSDRRLTLRMISSIGKSLKDSGKGWHVCDQALHALGCCTTTTHHVTRQSPSMNFWQKKRIPVVPQPHYLPDLGPCDFFLFLRLKNHLKGHHFVTLDNIQKSVTDELKGIPAEAFQHCYEQWKQRLRRCVAAQGDYFEGDNLDL